jgi:sortase A
MKAWEQRAFGAALLLLGVIVIARAAYIPAKAALAQALLERAWIKVQAGEKHAKPWPWPWADISPLALLEVSKLHRRSIVLEGASGAAMAFGPGHMPNTPPIGAAGTAIIAAHRDTQFAFLGALGPGDWISVTTADGQHHGFRVTETRIVRADASGLDAEDKSAVRLALVTCYPFSGVLHSPWRYVVLATRAGGEDKTASGA